MSLPGFVTEAPERQRRFTAQVTGHWVVYHVILNVFHSLPELAVHGVLLAVVAYLLLRPKAAAYFRRSTSEV